MNCMQPEKKTEVNKFEVAQLHYMHGVTLIELLVVMTFGLVLITATMSVYFANNQTYRQVQNMLRLNESARIAFELLGRDFREAGSTPCTNKTISNILNDKTIVNFGDNQRIIAPYGGSQALPTRDFGTGTAQRATGTDAVIISNTVQESRIKVVNHFPLLSRIELDKTNHGFKTNDVVLACDDGFTTIFQASNDPVGSEFIEHAKSASSTTGNCTSVVKDANSAGIVTCLTTVDTNPPKTINNYTIQSDTGFVVKVATTSWFIAHNGRGSRSLYRIVDNSDPEEMIDGVIDMQIEYLVKDAIDSEPFDYVHSSNYATTAPRPLGVSTGTYTWWPAQFNIVAARVSLTLIPGTTAADGSVNRTVTSVFSLRNHKF